MLVCRDLEKAIDKYGFGYTFPPFELQRTIPNKTNCEVNAFIEKDTKEFHIYVCNVSEDFFDDGLMLDDLDFLYDMIKDGVIEKVEA